MENHVLTSVPFFTQPYFDNVHDVMARLRDDGPGHRSTLPDGLPVRLITRYDDVRAALTDERLCKDNGSANRDHARFSKPDELDVHRGSRGHVAFGHGMHYCLGAPLARLEGEIALGQLLNRFPDARIGLSSNALRRRQATIMNGHAALPVLLGGQARRQFRRGGR